MIYKRVQFQNLTNPSATIDGVVPPVGAETPGTPRDSVLQITYNLFTGTRTQTPESGTVQKLLPPGEDGNVFVLLPQGALSADVSLSIMKSDLSLMKNLNKINF